MDTAADTDTAGSSGGRGQGRRRGRQPAPRRHRVGFVLTDQEYAAVQAASRRAGQAKGAYAAQAVLAATQEATPGADAPMRAALAELMHAAGLVHRIGVNLNQAVAKLNATGQRSGDLLPYAAESVRRARHLDEAADQVRKALR
jgi:predicted chitinase